MASGGGRRRKADTVPPAAQEPKEKKKATPTALEAKAKTEKSGLVITTVPSFDAELKLLLEAGDDTSGVIVDIMNTVNECDKLNMVMTHFAFDRMDKREFQQSRSDHMKAVAKYRALNNKLVRKCFKLANVFRMGQDSAQDPLDRVIGDLIHRVGETANDMYEVIDHHVDDRAFMASHVRSELGEIAERVIKLSVALRSRDPNKKLSLTHPLHACTLYPKIGRSGIFCTICKKNDLLGGLYMHATRLGDMRLLFGVLSCRCLAGEPFSTRGSCQ